MVMMGEMLRRAKTDRTTLAQCISIVQSRAHGEQARDLLDAIASELDIYATTSMRLGICGSPGSGKSSLIEAVGSHYLQADQRARLAVLACDPTSVASGGSLMGDCTRMPRLVSEERCFLRPTPTPTLGATSSVVSSAWDTLTLFSCIAHLLSCSEKRRRIPTTDCRERRQWPDGRRVRRPRRRRLVRHVAPYRRLVAGDEGRGDGDVRCCRSLQMRPARGRIGSQRVASRDSQSHLARVGPHWPGHRRAVALLPAKARRPHGMSMILLNKRRERENYASSEDSNSSAGCTACSSVSSPKRSLTCPSIQG